MVGERRYSPKEVANVLGCSVALVSQLCLRRRKTRDDKIDPRHFDDVRAERKYSGVELARKFSCSYQTIYKLRQLGCLESSPLLTSYRIPGWSVRDFIAENASPSSTDHKLQFVSIFTLIRIPGWSLIDYIENNCSEI